MRIHCLYNVESGTRFSSNPRIIFMSRPAESANRHDRGISLATSASGLAESTLSIGELASLSKFPSPPEGIPTTGLQSAFEISSPPGNASNSSSPVTPTGSNFRMPLAGNGASKRHGSPAGSTRSKRSYTSNQPSPLLQRTFAHNDYAPVPPLNPSRHKAMQSTASSKGEWHEGSSEVVVDDVEDRLLPTSFITGLLSSAEDSISVSESTRADARKHYPPSYLTSGNSSITSEMAYFPPGIRTPQPDIVQTNLHHLPTLQPHNPEHSRSTQPSPSFLALDPEARSVAGSIGMFDGNEGGSIIRTASMTRKLGARGASVVGVAPATLRKVSRSALGSPSNNASATSLVGTKNHSARSTLVTSDETGGQRLTIPDFNVPTTAIYSPAQQSSIGIRNSSRTQTTNRQSTMSLMSSFIPRFSIISSGTRRESRPIQQTLSSWFGLKPLPRLPVHPNIPTAVEAEHRKADEALPLPELVDRADALSGMLEKGQFPHISVNSTSSPNQAVQGLKRHDPTDITPWESLSAKDKGTVGNSPDTLAQSWKGEPADTNDQVDRSLLGRPKRVPMTRRQQMVAIGAFLLSLLALIVGLSVGLTLKPKHKLADCPGNFTGNACNLGR